MGAIRNRYLVPTWIPLFEQVFVYNGFELMSQEPPHPEVLIIRNWPKMIFMWPTAVMALAAGLAASFIPAWDHFFGAAFLICFLLNLLVITYDFPRSTSLTMLIAIIAVILAVVLINQRFGIIEPLQRWLSKLELTASAEFYYAIFAGMLLLYIGMGVVTRFDYWELTSNELVHHTGLLGNLERFSTGGLKLNTEINDVFEYILAGAGRIIMTIPGNPRPVVLDNVLRISRVMDLSKELLSHRVVEIAHEEHANRKEEKQQQSQDEYE